MNQDLEPQAAKPDAQQRRLVAGSIAFTVIWTAAMVWWSGDYRLSNIVMIGIAGAIVGALWFWWMKRFMLRQTQK